MIKDRNHSLDGILALLLFAFVLALGVTDMWETDSWWHLAAGRRIVEKQTPAPADAFSHTRYGRPFVNDEWLGDAYLYGIYNRQGRAGLAAAVGLIAAAAFYLVLGACRQRGASVPIAVAVIALGAVAARTRFSPRPEIFSLLFLSLNLYLLGRFVRSSPDDARARNFLWLVPVFQMMWVNAHPSGLIGVGIIILMAVSGAVAFLAAPRNGDSFLTPVLGSAKLRTLGTILLVSAFFSLCNPYFLHGLTAPFSFSQNNTFLRHIVEWTPIRFHELTAIFRPEANADPQIMAFEILALLGVIGLIARGRRQDIFDGVLFIVTLFMALHSRRFIALFAVASCPGIAAGISCVLQKRTEQLARFATPARILAIVFLAALGYQQVRLDSRFHFGTGISRKFPVSAITFIKDNHIDGRMYNDYGLGGFIIWNLYPSNLVFMDGRTTFYGTEMFDMQHRFNARPSAESWRQIEKTYEIDYAILSSREAQQCSVYRAIRTSSPRWKLVFWDDRAMILVKGNDKFKSIINRFEYKLTSPCSVTAITKRWREMDSDTLGIFISELKRSLKKTPDNIIALRALAFIKYGQGRSDIAEKYALRGVKADPDSAFFHVLLGQISLSRNDKNGAEKHFSEAERIDRKLKRKSGMRLER